MRPLLVALTAAGLLTCVGAPPQPCTECSGKCVDTQTDSKNCGACGTACMAGNVCSAGKCVAACSMGQSACSSGCTDTQADPKNCGACGTACTAGEVCTGGQCGLQCSLGYSMCVVAGQNLCVDITADGRHCGMCNNACGAGQVCSAAQCVTQCTGSRTVCSPAGQPAFCTDKQTDPANCGTCGNACPQGTTCNNGTCDVVCNAPLVSCVADAGTTPNYCANTANDSLNCGTCGRACGPQQFCSNGTCRSVIAQSCAELQTVLGGTGIDGPAVLFLDGKPWLPFKATCADMDGGATVGTVFGTPLKNDAGMNQFDAGNQLIFWTDSGIVVPGGETGPKTYLDLPNQGAAQNYSQYNNVGFGGFPPFLTNKWAKVRFDPSSQQVFVQDYRFVTTSGVGGNMRNDNLHYGMGAACNGSARGTANIDLRGTPFFVDTGNQWASNFSCCNGMGGGTAFSQQDQVVDTNGGGSCGGWDLYTNPYGSYRLQLRHRAITCDTIRRANTGSPNGVYNLLDGTSYDGGTAPAGSQLAYCDMTAGGFTLVMKIDGTKTDSRFFYDDPLWTNDAVYNAGVPNLDRVEAKYATYMSAPFTDIRIVTFDGMTAITPPLQMNFPPGASLHAVFSAGTYAGPPGFPIPPTIINAFGGGTLQPNCGRPGFNDSSPVAKVRLGILMNNENDCLSPDSYAGIGGLLPYGQCAGPTRPTFRGYSAGAFGATHASCAPNNGTADKGVFAYVYVR